MDYKEIATFTGRSIEAMRVAKRDNTDLWRHYVLSYKHYTLVERPVDIALRDGLACHALPLWFNTEARSEASIGYSSERGYVLMIPRDNLVAVLKDGKVTRQRFESLITVSAVYEALRGAL